VRQLRSAVVSALLGGLVAVTGIIGPVSAADAQSKPGGKTGGSTAQALGLTSETSWSNPNAPAWCMTEDDYDYRTFSGSINGSYSTSYRLCSPSVDYYNGMWWDAGGEGLEADVYASGQISGLSITAPDGTVHNAVLIGQSTSRGATTYHYAACYVPPYYRSTDTSTNPLAGGVWQLALSGQVSNVTWTTRDDMTDVTFQQTYCPSSEQNLL
jgi:hypothetical protein